MQRGKKSGLFNSSTEKPVKANLEEFLLHGLRYVFPAEAGPRVRGIPTAHSAPPLSEKIVSQPNDALVWASPKGRVLGARIEPIYPSVTKAIQSDVQLYEILALIDALRVGRVREQKLATQELIERFKSL